MKKPDVTIEKSETVNEEIRSICVNYMRLMADCMENNSVKDDFLKNPHPYLNDKVGMKIPENIPVMFSENLSRWPAIYIKTPEGDNIAVKEANLGVSVLADMASGAKLDETWKVTEPARIDMRINVSLEKSQAVIVLPFMDPGADVLGEYKFSDGAEVVLSCI